MKVVVLEMASVALAQLGCYGSEWADTPTLDRLAAEGVVFDQHFADSLDAANRTSWTGRHSLPLPEGDLPLPPLCLFPLLEAGGVRVRHVTEADGDHNPAASLVDRWTGTLEAALAELEQAPSESQALVWVDLPSLVPPWNIAEAELQDHWHVPEGEAGEATLTPWLDPPSGSVEHENEQDLLRLQETSTAVFALMDRVLHAFLEVLAEQGWLDDILLVVTARTGLPLGEHGFVGTADLRLHEEVVHLPLLVRLPRAEQAGRRVAGLTQPVDFVPTLLEYFGLSVPADLHGRSLWPLARGNADQVRPYACSGLRTTEGLAWGLRTPEWAFLLTRRQEQDTHALFQKPDDRWEVNDLRQHYPELTEQIGQTLRAYVQAAAAPGMFDVPAVNLSPNL